MNENPNNRSGIPQKQINRVVAPIQVDQNGNRVENQQSVTPKIVNTSIREVVNPNGSTLPLEKQKKEHDPINTVFVLAILIILACVCAIIFYIIVPRYLANENRLRYNDATTTKRDYMNNINMYTFKSASINGGAKVTTTGTFAIDSAFQIGTFKTENDLAILINGKQVTTTKSLVPTIGRIDDLIIMLLNDGNNRQNRVVIYDQNGNSVLEMKNIEGVDGMLISGDVSSLIINSNSLVIVASRVSGNNLILNNTYGDIEGTNVCDSVSLLDQGVSDEYMVIGTYSIEYEGNHKFSNPESITNVNLGEYKTSHRYCQ